MLLKRILFWKPLNYILTRMLRPFSGSLSRKMKIPVWGSFGLKTHDGTRIKFAANYTSWHGKLLFWDGIRGYEHEVTSLFSELIKDAEVFLDVGANIGYYSLLAKASNPETRVHAFEPLPDAVHYLNKNLQLNGWQDVQVHTVALSNVSGSLTFESRVSVDFPNEPYQIAGDSSLVNYDNTDRRQIDVTAITLDEYFPQLGVNRVDYIKLDTETTEHLILAGSKGVISQHRPILQCEVLRGHNEGELESFVKELDYQQYLIVQGGIIPVMNLQQLEEEKNDCLFVPTEKQEQISKLIIREPEQ